MAAKKVKYFVFDVESVADGKLVRKIRYPGDPVSPADAISRYRSELIEKNGTDFIPYTFQIPISIVIAKVSADFRLMDLVALDSPEYRSHVIVDNFWRGWEGYKKPTLVSFNGRTFDIPLLELAAYRYGLSVPAWFNINAKSFEQHRNRYNTQAHLDLHDVLTNFGASRFTGGLNLASNLTGKPGKMDIQGHMVQDLFNEGRVAEINDYCRCDVLDTYFAFLRTSVLVGWITLDEEQVIVAEAKEWLESQCDDMPVYADYLSQWGDWENPWVDSVDTAGDDAATKTSGD